MLSPKVKKVCSDCKPQEIKFGRYAKLIKDLFEDKCSECCLAHVQNINFETLFEYPQKIEIFHQAIRSGFSNVVKFIVETAHEEILLKAYRHKYECINMKFICIETNNEEIHNIFLDDKVFMKCVRVSSDKYSDLADAIINYEEKCPRNVVEKLVKHTLEYEPSEIGQQELEYVVQSCIRCKKVKHLDIVLKNNKCLLNEVWSHGNSFIHELVGYDSINIGFIEKMYEKYHPNLTLSNSGGTALHKIMNTPFGMGDEEVDLFEKLLIWEPKLSAIPRDSDGMTPLHNICCSKWLVKQERHRISLCRLLIEKYAVDVNALDSKGNPALYCACNCDTMIYLLKHNARTDLEEKEKKHNQYYTTEEVINVVENVLDGSLTLDIFNSLVSCVVKVRGSCVRNLAITELVAKKTDLDFNLFYKICLILKTHNIFNFNNIKYFAQDYFTRSFPYIIFMPLTTTELYYVPFDISPRSYGKKKFQNIKEFISIRNFNTICMGREISTLQHLSRIVIRKEIFKSLGPENKKHPFDIFESLEIPNCLKEYLYFLDNIQKLTKIVKKKIQM